MNLLTSLRSEFHKIKGSYLLYLCVFGAGVVPLLAFFEYGEGADAIEALQGDPWNYYFGNVLSMQAVFGMPVFIVLVATLLPQLEYRSNTWKQLLTSPQPYACILLSKFIMILSAAILFVVIGELFMTCSLILVNAFNPEVRLFSHSIKFEKLLWINLKLFLSTMSLGSLQLWMGMRFKNFIWPILTGVIFHVIGVLVCLVLNWEHAYILPYTYPIYALSDHFHFQKAVPGLIGYTTIFLLLTYFELAKVRLSVKG